MCTFKGIQAWDSYEFFWPNSKPSMTLVNICNKFRIFYFDFCQKFDVRTFSRWLNIRGTNFCCKISEIFKMFTLVLLDGSLTIFQNSEYLESKIAFACGFFGFFSKIIAEAEMFKSRISRTNRIRFSKISCYRLLTLLRP